MGQDCKYCGAYISGRADKCPACGKRISYKGSGESARAAGEERPREENRAYTYKNEYENRYGGMGDKRTEYTAAETRPESRASDDVSKNKLISYLCYFGLLFLIPYLLRPDSDFVKFHSNQGLVLMIASAVGGFVAGFVPLLGGFAGLLVEVLVFVGFVKGLINVNKGLKEELPIIGGIKILTK